MKKTLRVVCALMMILSLTACAQAQTTETTPTTTATAETTLSATVKNADQKTTWDNTATGINLSDSGITVTGNGATVQGSVVTITQAGTFVVSGKLSDGQIVINATKDEKIHLILNGVDITNKTGAPLYGVSCDKLTLTLAGGTVNTLTDGGSAFQYANTTDEEPNAALFCKDDLTINGEGSLTVNAGFNNGIGTKDDLLILSGNITVNAANHALRGKDSVTILGGTLNLTAGNDGIQTNNQADASLGWVLIEGGTINITSAHDGIQADTTLQITGGDLHITAGGGAKKATTVTSAQTTSDSFKGIKATGNILITNGTLVIDSYDDSVHANGNITITGGNLTLSTGDDGVHADGELNVTDGVITVVESYEGLEAAHILIAGGKITLASSDDGINAAGGAGGQSGFGRFGMDMFSQSGSGSYTITITGGEITLAAGGDGLDSNGDITISGGTIISFIKSTADNGGMDCDGTFTATGGTIIYGGTGVGNTPGNASTQSYAYFTGSISAGDTVSLLSGNSTIVTFTAPLAAQYLAISTPDVVSGQSYTLVKNGTQLASATAGTGGGGMGGFGGGRGGNMGGGMGGRR